MRLTGLVVMLVLLVACSSAGSTTLSEEPTTTAASSFACINAVAAAGLSTGSTVDRARQNLNTLIADPSSTQLEAEYFGALLAAIEDHDDMDTVGDAFDAVPCELT